MTARIQRMFVIGLFALALGAAATLTWLGRPVLGIGAALVILAGYSAVLATELVCMRFVEGVATRPSVPDLVQAWCNETVAAAKVFGWRQPFRSNFFRDVLPKVPNGRRGVLLVHGLICNRGFWAPWMEQLALDNRACIAVNLEPVFGSISDFDGTIELAVNRLRVATGLAPVIVAHSMGGLVVRHWMSARNASNQIHRVITIGTPHQGTWLARFGTSKSARQMGIGSRWLKALAAAEGQSDYRLFTCFYGSCDNVVFPSISAQLPGADNRIIGRTGHVALAFRKEVFAEARRWLESSAPG